MEPSMATLLVSIWEYVQRASGDLAVFLLLAIIAGWLIRRERRRRQREVHKRRWPPFHPPPLVPGSGLTGLIVTVPYELASTPLVTVLLLVRQPGGGVWKFADAAP